MGVIDWTMEECREHDQMTRKQMNIYKSLHPRSDIDGLYVPRKEGGRGLRSLEDLVLIEKTSLTEYVNNSQEQTLQKLKSGNCSGFSKYLTKQGGNREI